MPRIPGLILRYCKSSLSLPLDRSTPQHDAFYGGESDLLAAYGWQEDGKTTLRFKKDLGCDRKADHVFEGNLMFIWAIGQSGNSFYPNDELKFHTKPNSGVGVIGEEKTLITLPALSQFQSLKIRRSVNFVKFRNCLEAPKLCRVSTKGNPIADFPL